ncbi:MAG: hypothetical protein FIB06_12525 [Betaproteobacteria bacterium]|nr:hypothetical protein [Betaproteobacteria bacterium]
MTTSDKPAASMILDAIRAKRERRTSGRDIAEVEAALIADLDSFDIDSAERSAQAEEAARIANALPISALAFPEIVPEGTSRTQADPSARAAAGLARAQAGGGLLGELRGQAEIRQRELHAEMAERSSANLALDNALRYLFFYLHDLVQQLNIVKPGIPHQYVVAGAFTLTDLAWQEGFTDYRTQSQSAGALIELVSLTCQLASPHEFNLTLDGAGATRFRNTIFDYGLQFDCKEFRNDRAYLERAEFSVRGQLSVNARWRADFAGARLVLEMRNLERLGSTSVTVRPGAVDQALLDDFGRLLLGQPNRFRELARR